MSLFFFIPFVPLLGGLLTLTYHFRDENTNLLSNVFIFISLILSLFLALDGYKNIYYSLNFFEVNNINFVIKLQIDNLTITMLLLINFISFIIHRYSTSYLASDITQGRFMAQLSILTASVSFMVMSGNLLTAFLGWQFIGLSLYILLNHYHYDDKANKAAKKKFIINRVGDLSFLCAVILCYKYTGNSDFDCLLNKSVNILIFSTCSASLNTIVVCLIFIAVMAKSAQFPFHIWLPDTMETPTPVSAIMHAGVINAGGFLLTRIHSMLNNSNFATQIIFTVGIISIITSSFFMLTQSDIKKQLAYSTMGQMGFMVVQCSLGIYSAAIFHLIAHGFLKAFLFLSAGSNIKDTNEFNQRSQPKIIRLFFLMMFLLTFGMFYHYYSKNIQLSDAAIISSAFISLTLATIFYEVIKLQQSVYNKIILSLLTILIIYLYRCFSLTLSSFLNIDNSVQNNIDFYKLTILFVVLLIQLIVYLSLGSAKQITNKLNLWIYHLSRNKLFIEELYRNILINPYRKIGDTISQVFSLKIGSFLIVIIMFILIYFASLGLNYTLNSLPIVIFNQLIFIIFVSAANRALNIRSLNIYILIAQLCLINMGLFSYMPVKHELVYYQIINSILIFASIEVLINNKNDNVLNNFADNKLSFSNMYFTILLFLCIGMPSTASFISEINVLYSLANTQLWLLAIVSIGFIMLAIAILHALQEYVFSSNASNYKLKVQLSSLEHMFLIFSIFFNILSGIYPSLLLSKLS
ncbi:MAG: proton-conducting transporter membrane subunit [Neisseriaceae bacterium]